MFHHKADDFLRAVRAKWYLLVFLAGNVNAGAFMATERFVTHVTGFATLLGIDVANGRFDQGVGIASLPIFFLIGSAASAYVVDRRVQKGLKPHYDWVMLTVAICLTIAALAGHYDFFGKFGETLRLKQDYLFLALLCLASGLQNAAISTSSGASVRTTHLTGATTDLGIGIVRLISSERGTARFEKEMRAFWMRFWTIGSFIVGSIIGAILFLQVNYLGFLLPAAIALYAMLQARREESLPHADVDFFREHSKNDSRKGDHRS